MHGQQNVKKKKRLPYFISFSFIPNSKAVPLQTWSGPEGS